jgi:MFS family permease
VALLLVYWFLPRGEETAVAAPPRLREHLQGVAGVITTHRRTLSAAGSGMLLAQTIRAGRQAIIPLFGADVLGLDVQAIGVIETAASAVDMSLFYPVGIVMDRWGRKFAIVPSFLVQGIGMALLPLAGGFGGLLAVTCLIGFGNGLGSGTMMTLGADLSPVSARGEFLGVWRFIGDIGFTVGPLVVGGIADLLRLQNAAVALAGIGALSAFIFARFVPETLRREELSQPPP